MSDENGAAAAATGGSEQARAAALLGDVRAVRRRARRARHAY